MLLKKTAALLVLTILTIGTVACSHVEDPWVPSSSYLKQERERSPQLAMQMRIRVMETQTDR